MVTPVPEDPKYGYVLIGQQRVIVGPQTRRGTGPPYRHPVAVT
ncbi:hypothetical protein GFM01_25725 [Rhizobium laguerreae]|nr:hypothetical protein [Rhizobium laguerreae]